MSMEKVSVLVPALPPVPRGAVWVGHAVDALLAAFARERDAWRRWRSNQRRRREAERSARRDAADRAALVALARSFEGSQPEFAKDLYAAARVDRDR